MKRNFFVMIINLYFVGGFLLDLCTTCSWTNEMSNLTESNAWIKFLGLKTIIWIIKKNKANWMKSIQWNKDTTLLGIYASELI